jgi:hypothetical protein
MRRRQLTGRAPVLSELDKVEIMEGFAHLAGAARRRRYELGLGSPGASAGGLPADIDLETTEGFLAALFGGGLSRRGQGGRRGGMSNEQFLEQLEAGPAGGSPQINPQGGSWPQSY